VNSGETAGAPDGSLLDATVSLLRRYPPFDEMQAEALRFLAARLALRYYPQGTTILCPQDGEPQFLFIVQRGQVRLTPSAAGVQGLAGETTLGPGECFSIGALLEHRPTGSTYSAAVDTFCYLLAAADFRELLHRSPRFQDFATDYLASLLRESRRLLRMNAAAGVAEERSENRPLRSLLRRSPVACTPETPLASALRRMQEEKVGSIVVVASGGEPVGIFTRHDVLDRVALAGADLAQRIAAVMTPDPVTLPAEASVYDAALVMAKHGIRHVIVVDEGRFIGVVTERDLFALQRASMRQINRTIATARELADLQQAARDIRNLAGHLLAEGVTAEPLTLMISTLNDALTRRLIVLEQARHAIADLDYCWLAFGSEGRYEQTISSDQDNGIIFSDSENGHAERVRQRLVPFARAVNSGLDACGFPLCRGEIMAGNPRWCMSLAEWRGQFVSWADNTDPQALLGAVIFFDFRPIHGNHGLADALRATLMEIVKRNPRFLRQMAEQALLTQPPLGLFRDFVVDDDGTGHPHTLDLKNRGARLFVDAARVMALATGVVHTGTAQRLRQAGPRIRMETGEIEAAVEAFYFIQSLRLRRQLSMHPEEGSPNRIDPRTLNEVDRRILKECLRQAQRLQSRLKLDYQL
jgi:CBS domain-containing protein